MAAAENVSASPTTSASPPQRVRRRRECRFCREKIDLIDYKDVETLKAFTPERGKIMPRRLSGVCAPHQRMLTRAVKRARNMALLPYVTD
ncbi:30S ribosomal protein S18 [bacterium HR08]|jgi:small subunit ribosomal protein S18|nr:30S ribosomal protein S18 [bacterium HR08]